MKAQIQPDVEKNYYFVLGASEEDSQVEIERLYKRLAKRHHPDHGGSAEKMKAVNEAYRVLGNEAARRAYDTQRQPHLRSFDTDATRFSIPPTLLEENFSGRLAVAMWWLIGGLVFLFLVKFFYLRFLWPVFALAAIVVLVGVWKIRAALVFGRTSLALSHPLRRYFGAQEAAFWLVMCGGAYGIYLVLNAI
jgi:DnaJ-like protein